MTKPLVSVLISAYNAEDWIGYTLQSAVAQTWPNKEIIVVDDGSTDGTAEIARQFIPRGVTVISIKNGGLSAGQNCAYRYSHGDYIQFLDADDVLALDKIERQLSALTASDTKRVLLSSPWAPFYYRTRRAHFIRNSVWEDLTPLEWLLRKLGENLHMQNATWLVSRELAEAAGPWDESLWYDQDGEYFTRVLMASEHTKFVPETGIFYRQSTSRRVSYIGDSDEKKESLVRSMKFHIRCLLSLEDTERTRKACLTYLQNWYHQFYGGRADLAEELQGMAAELGGSLQKPQLGWKYAWMKPILGWEKTKWAQTVFPELKASCIRQWDKTMYRLENNPNPLPIL
ncbi:MAG TPA: glycosyltransferase family A protein [Terriglobales bacterium]|nr:glycosyltransferase family A protein [Terriglobales bacterium]